MRISINTDDKTVKLDSRENLGKLFILLEKMLENWREYDIEANTTIVNWSNPIIIDRYPYWKQPYYYTNVSYAGNTSNNASSVSVPITGGSNSFHNTKESSNTVFISGTADGTYNLEVN